MEMKGKSIIVTGAGQGIGFEICREAVRQGASVLLNDVDESLAEKAVARVGKESGTCLAFAGDASDPQFIQKMVDAARDHFGQLDAVIANAGITVYGDFLEYKPEVLQKIMKLNLGGSFFLAQAAAKQMIRQKSGGSILLMSSVTGHQAAKDLTAYGMTKAALEMLAKGLVVELSSYGITVNAIAPGATLTERTQEDAHYKENWSRITPMGRPATPLDIAHAAIFLISDRARHITGQSLVVDGGWTSISPSP